MMAMLLVKRIGLFHIETDGFQEATLPYPRRVIDALSKHVPNIAAKRNDALLKIIKVRFTCNSDSKIVRLRKSGGLCKGCMQPIPS